MKNQNKPGPNQQLRLERLQRQWSQQELADRIGTTIVSINRWERGVTAPTPYFRLKLCALFGKSAPELGLLAAAMTSNTGTPPPEPIDKTTPSLQLSTQTPFWHLPFQRNPFFTGRETLLTHIQTRLQTSNIRVHALSGLGGIGKTQTAIEYAYRFRGMYSAVIWIRAETPEIFNFDCIHLASKFERLTQGDQQEPIERVKQWLLTQQNWLLIFDNVDDMSLVERFLPSFIQGYVLITTRAQAIGPLAEQIHVHQMTTEESTILLLRRAKLLAIDIPLKTMPQQFVEAAMAIIRSLDSLPLAIDQAGAYIEETGCTLEEYQERYQRHRLALLSRRGTHTMDHPDSVVATVSLCVERVKQRNPAAADLLYFCAFLQTEALYEEILHIGASALNPLLAEIVRHAFLFDEAIASLRTVSLLHRDTKSKQLTLHRLIQTILKDSLTDPIQRQWAEEIIRVINLAFPQTSSMDTIQRCERLLPQVFVCADLIAQWRFTFSEAACLLHKAGSYVLFRGQYARAERFLHDALDLYRQGTEIDEIAISSILTSLGTIYEAQARYNEAAEAYQQALALREKRLPFHHPDIIEILTYLGRVELCQANYTGACTALERILSCQEPQLNQSPHQLIAFHLAATLYHQQGSYTQAEDILQRAITLCKQNLGETHPSTIESLSKLTLFYSMHGQHKAAEDLYQETITLFSKTGVDASYQTVSSLRNLGLMYCLQGQYEQAEALLRQALAICQRTFGSTHTETAESLKYLAIMYRMMQRYEQAIDALTRAHMLLTNVFGIRHPEIAEIFHSLGIIYSLQGKYKQAKEALQQSITIFSILFSPSHPDTLESLRALDAVYNLQGQYPQMETLS